MRTRRTILTGLALAPVAAVPAVAAETPKERVERLFDELQVAMHDCHGGRWLASFCHERKVVALARLGDSK